MLICVKTPIILDNETDLKVSRWLRERGLGFAHSQIVTSRIKGFNGWTMDRLAVHENWNNRFKKCYPNSLMLHWDFSGKSAEWWFPESHKDTALLFKLTFGGV